MMLQSLIRRAVILLLLLSVAACGSANSQADATPTVASAATDATAPADIADIDTTQAVSAVAKLNLNTASAEEFLTVPNVGDRMVREFEEYQPYVSIQQFRREIGKYVDAQQVAEYEKYLYVPIDVNEADAATLQQIPGLDETEAAALIAARPFDSNDAFLGQLAQYVSQAELSVAETYLSNP